MRVLLFANNWVGWQVAEQLQAHGATIVGVVVHPQERRQYGDEIIRSTGVDPACIFDGTQLRRTDIQAAIQALKPDIGVSAFFGYILKPKLVQDLPHGCINIHPAYLPFNRGAYPNVWSIVDGTPAGVTIHYIDEGIDTGPTIAQCVVPVEPIDTGLSLYRKLEQAAVELFAETWPRIAAGDMPIIPQLPGQGSHHRVADVASIDEIDLDQTYTARELINILRARTFPPYRGAYIRDNERTILLELNLRYEER